MFNGIDTSISNLYRLSNAQTRSICAENPTGEKGKGGMAETGVASHSARDLGIGWKINPFVKLQPNTETVLADIDGSGCIQHIWMTPAGGAWRHQILRIYWDNNENPSVECPIGDFFACGWGEYAPVNSLAICVNPGSAFNCYWSMPFRKHCKITIENREVGESVLYYQIDYCLTEIAEDAAYFHAQFRRQNPLPYKDVYTIVDGIEGKGHFVGTYMCWGVNNNGWWGEGEIKFFMDGDKEFPTICGTGTEDYFCGSYNFENQKTHQYQEFSTPYAGMPQVIIPDGLYRAVTRFGLYRWHITDPIRFESDLKVTIQDLGWRADWKYHARQDDLASVAFWYQTLPFAKFPKLPDKEGCEMI